MKKVVILILFQLHLFVAFSISDTAFVRTYGGKNIDIARDVKQTHDNGFILVGTTSSFGNGASSIYLVKTDSNGYHQWSTTIGGINVDWAYSVCETFDKGFSICGYTNSKGYGGYDAYLIKTDSFGKVLWEKTYGGTDWDFGYSMTQVADSGFVVCGETYSFTNGGTDAYVIRTDKNGDTLWTRHYGGPKDDAAYSVIMQNDTNIVIVGKTTTTGNLEDVYFAKIDLNGNIITTKTFGGSKNDYANNICNTSDGGFAIVGTSNSFSSGGADDVYVVKTNSAGALGWAQIVNSGPGAIFAKGYDITQIRNGNLDISGILNGYGLGGNAMYVLRIDQNNGGWMSSAAFGGIGDEAGYAIERTKTGGIVYAGSTTSFGQGQEDMYFVKMYNEAVVSNYTLNSSIFNDNLSPLSIDPYSNFDSNGISIYPNPFNSETTFKLLNSSFSSNDFVFELFDILGNKIRQQTLSQQSKFTIYKENLSSGTYFYSIFNSTKSFRGKLLIN